MRCAPLFALVLVLCAACSDDDSDHDRDHTPRAGKGGSTAVGRGGSGGSGGSQDAGLDSGTGAAKSRLERQGTLPRPPKDGLPAELRPPR